MSFAYGSVSDQQGKAVIRRALEPRDQRAVAPLTLALGTVVDPRLYGELVQFGRVISWR